MSGRGEIMSLDEHIAIVTGAGRGIGRAIAKQLSQDGARVVVATLEIEEAESVCQEITSNGGLALGVQVDVTDGASVSAMVETVTRQLGTPSILVNNAGWDQIERFIDSSEAEWWKVLDINLVGQMRCCRAILSLMMEQNYGRIINIGSDAGRVGTSGQVMYSAAKGGVIAFTKALAREVSRHGITVNCVAPGPTNTPLYQEVKDSNPKLAEALMRAIPMRRFGEPEDVAFIVSMLAHSETAYVTGQVISVSGGLTMA